MLDNSTKAWLKAMGIEPDALINAVKDSKEVAIAKPEGSFYTDEAIDEMKVNVKKGHEEAYPEILGKTLNEKYELGLSTKDAKNIEKVMEAMQSKGAKSANIEPSKKIQELEESLQRMRETYDKDVSEWKSKYTEREEYDNYASVVPENANKFLTKAEHVARVKSMLKIGENGVAVDVATGAVLKDKLEKPIMFKDAVAELYKTRENWLEPAQVQPQAKPFSHSTSSSAAKKAGQFDHQAAYEKAMQQYDVTTPEGRAAARAAIQNEAIASQG